MCVRSLLFSDEPVLDTRQQIIASLEHLRTLNNSLVRHIIILTGFRLAELSCRGLSWLRLAGFKAGLVLTGSRLRLAGLRLAGLRLASWDLMG